MVPVTMYALRYGIIEPALKYGYSLSVSEQLQLQFASEYFLLLVLINVFLGAAGYVINDYFDRKIDSINRPGSVLVGNTIPRRTAITLHFVFNTVAVLISAYLAWQLQKVIVVLIYLAISGVFWLYSTTYKKQFLVGNIIVALGAAMIPLQVAYFEIIMLNRAYGKLLLINGLSFKALLYWLLAFAFFAFIINLIREIIKDIEDFEGDRSYGCNTIPVVAGISASKTVAFMLMLATIGTIGYIYFSFLNDPLSFWYLTILVVLPLALASVLTIQAKKIKHYTIISYIIKLTMLTGVLYSLVARYIMVFNFTV
jgi:4-hydroxybenzoate polyprenyltransferase